jgi:hypothetical protein
MKKVGSFQVFPQVFQVSKFSLKFPSFLKSLKFPSFSCFMREKLEGKCGNFFVDNSEREKLQYFLLIM